MLEMTLATNFIPGSNLKGKVAGAAWLFLLPSIDLRRVVCVGAPLPSTLEALLSFSQKIILATSLESPKLDRRAGTNGVVPVSFAYDSILPLKDGYADLILLSGAENIRQFNENKRQRAELIRLLATDGIIYCEGREYFLSRTGQAEWEGADGGPGLATRFWQTPLNGEMHTAVPLDDAATSAYFLQNKLTSPLLNLPALLAKRVKRFAAARNEKPGAAPTPSTAAAVKPVKPRPSLKRSLRGAGLGLLGTMQRAEELVDQKRPVRRVGFFYGGPRAELGAHPPRYLRSIAQEAGIDLDNYGWGLSARGEYSSRKMLFFLFDREQEPGRAQPDIIVKMVRDPIFNYRLENEAQSLQLLDKKGLLDPEILPEVLFSGHHGGLSIVGERVIEGVPFRQKAKATADCPYGQTALDWFVDLGAATADTQAAPPSEIGAALTQLLGRFAEIYRPTAEQHDFLAEQIAKVGDSETAVPLVFQHGDPGPWNMLVTPGERVAVLDWEAAEPAGMPAWDLFYLMRSLSLDAARKLGMNKRLVGFKQQFLDDTALSRLYVHTMARYCQRTGLDGRLLEPLFYTCWMHRALKESMRLEPAKLGQGHFVNLIWWCREHRDSATLSRLFSLAAEHSA